MKQRAVVSKADLLNSACGHLNQHLNEPVIKTAPAKQLPNNKGLKEKRFIHQALKEWCTQKSLLLVTELGFHPFRKWRFDYAVFRARTIDQIKAKDWTKEHIVFAVEYEGLFSEKSGHTTIKGFSKDVEKYNEAAVYGWPLIRLTAINYKSVKEEIEKYEKNCE